MYYLKITGLFLSYINAKNRKVKIMNGRVGFSENRLVTRVFLQVSFDFDETIQG